MSLIRVMRKFSFVLLAGLASASIACAADAPAGGKPKLKPYPLSICVVSGEKLGEMGEPKVIEYEGREIKFCCGNCEKDFRKDPAAYLKKIDAADPSKPK